MRTVKRHIRGGKRRAKKSSTKRNLTQSMPPIISVSKNGSITPYMSKKASRSKSKKSSNSKSPRNITLNVRNEAEADNALEIMKKSPMTIVLVFANWCPHCHSYMDETWNKMKKLPSRAPMVEMDAASEEPGAKEAVQEFLRNIKTPEGAPMEVNAFPTVLSVNKELVATPVENSRDESTMEELLMNNVPTEPKTKSENSPENATKNVASMDIPIVTSRESIEAATKAVKAGLANSSKTMTAIPREIKVKPTEVSNETIREANEESNQVLNESNVPSNEPTPDFSAPPTEEELDSGESPASRNAVAPGLRGGARMTRRRHHGGTLYEALSSYASGSPVLASLATAAAPAAILLAAQQSAAKRARIGKSKSRRNRK